MEKTLTQKEVDKIVKELTRQYGKEYTDFMEKEYIEGIEKVDKFPQQAE